MRFQFGAYHSKAEGTHWFSVMKTTLNMIGPPVGDPAPPVQPLPEQYHAQLREMLTVLGYEVGIKVYSQVAFREVVVLRWHSKRAQCLLVGSRPLFHFLGGQANAQST